jgi:D-beta-D-heptose 7-phosphate kinase / D-beta-D-heptose 1-phosphate adenosyltransferase
MSDKTLLDLLGKFHSARVLIVGDLMLDRFVYGSVERISPEAPIPVMAIERTVDMLGGAANVARNVATLGAQAMLIGVVGDDVVAGNMQAQFALIPTLQAELVSDTTRPTTIKTRHVADRQQILRTDVESRAPLSDRVADLLLARYRELLGRADVVILSDYAKGVLSERVSADAIEAARAAGRRVLVDPKARSFQKYRGASVLTPNRHELEVACGHPCATDQQIESGARAAMDQAQADAVVVTRGKEGMSIVRREGAPEHIRTVAKEVFDVSGAGDTAVATLGLGLANGASLGDAARLANAAAGVVVGKYGTASVTTGEIVARLGLTEEGQTSSKHFGLDSVQQRVAHWREQGLRIAFTNGCFDLLHPGHLSLLTQARQAADCLVVGLNSDLSVRRLKGPERPVQGEVARATVLASLKVVDAVVIFDEDTPLKLIDVLAPDVLVKGADYTVDTVVGADLVRQRGGKVLLAELVPSQSTSNTIARMNATRKA